jgi:hypothetical protein
MVFDNNAFTGAAPAFPGKIGLGTRKQWSDWASVDEQRTILTVRMTYLRGRLDAVCHEGSVSGKVLGTH